MFCFVRREHHVLSDVVTLCSLSQNLVGQCFVVFCRNLNWVLFDSWFCDAVCYCGLCCHATHTLATIAFQILSHTQCQLSTFRQGKQYFNCMLFCGVGRQLRQMFFTVCHKPYRELFLLQVPPKLWQGNWYCHSCSRTMNVLSHIVANIGLCFLRV